MKLETRITWLKWASILVIGFGMLLTVSLILDVLFIWEPFFDMAYFPTGIAAVSQAPDALLIAAILGGVFTGWGVMMWQIATQLMWKDPELARKLVLTSVGSWFVLDSMGSVYVGAPLNALYNLAFLAILIVPVLKPFEKDLLAGE